MVYPGWSGLFKSCPISSLVVLEGTKLFSFIYHFIMIILLHPQGIIRRVPLTSRLGQGLYFKSVVFNFCVNLPFVLMFLLQDVYTIVFFSLFRNISFFPSYDGRIKHYACGRIHAIAMRSISLRNIEICDIFRRYVIASICFQKEVKNKALSLPKTFRAK